MRQNGKKINYIEQDRMQQLMQYRQNPAGAGVCCNVGNKIRRESTYLRYLTYHTAHTKKNKKYNGVELMERG